MSRVWASGLSTGRGGETMMDYAECPCCGSRLVMMGSDLVTLEEAQDWEMDARIAREWERDREEVEHDGG